MGSFVPMELRFSSKTIGRFVARISKIDGASDNISVLDDFVNRLQDEMKKIDAFKRELPLCVDLLDEAIVTLKEELTQCKRSNAVPVLEEFIPLKNDISAEKDENIEKSKEKDISSSTDKMNWLSSVQLWNSDSQHHYQEKDSTNNTPTLNLDNNYKKRTEVEIKRPKTDNFFQTGESRTIGKTFLPLKRRVNEFPGVTGLALGTPEIKNPLVEIHAKPSSSRSGSPSATNGPSSFKDMQHASRKQRRCWSPELHRRFVNALQQLGGAQVATPKQIRELMQVDGLTNDEVKSHLQKYRLHARRTPPGTKTSSIQPVVLGRLWPTSQEQCDESPKRSISQSGSPQGPLNLTGSSQGTSMTGGDSMEDEDDEKSESHCWKSDIHLYNRDDI